MLLHRQKQLVKLDGLLCEAVPWLGIWNSGLCMSCSELELPPLIYFSPRRLGLFHLAPAGPIVVKWHKGGRSQSVTNCIWTSTRGFCFLRMSFSSAILFLICSFPVLCFLPSYQCYLIKIFWGLVAFATQLYCVFPHCLNKCSLSILLYYIKQLYQDYFFLI